MSAANHPNYELEIQKLRYTLGYLKNYHENILRVKNKIDQDVDYSVTHYNSDNAEQFNELIINTTIQDNLSQRLKNLEKARLKPYFARVDFTDGSNKKQEQLYIGKVSLLREEDNEFIIVDWRAPVANLYYEGRIGAASYQCPEGNIRGNIDLKRQYTIEDALLKEIYDIDITTNDDFLQACLGSSKDNRLKDIVSTIQEEQNKVIRADMWKPLIVQGAAGGGKTTIALHRIAYLLYNYEKTVSPKNFMIIAPNRFFLSYISEVLPELGVENVKQTTFEDFFTEVMDKRYKLKDSHEKLSKLIERCDEASVLKQISIFKSSLDFKDIIEAYIGKIEADFFPKDAFEIESYVIIEVEELQRLFLEEYKHLPMIKRVNEIKKHLINSLKREKINILDSIEHQADMEIQKIRDTMIDCAERRALIIEISTKRDTMLEKIRKHSKTLIREYLNKIKPLKPLEYYNMLFSNTDLMFDLSKNLDLPELSSNRKLALSMIGNHSLRELNKGYIEYEDIAPLMYIKHSIYGLDEELNLKHVIIDEAQDFSLFQLYILKKIVRYGSFTILGDLCQGIHSYRGVQNWDSVLEKIFNNDASSLVLEQSYRTTIEIMEAANKVIAFLNDPKLPAAKPVIRHGNTVGIYERCSQDKIASEIKEKLESMKTKGYKSAAVICKTLEECKDLKLRLSKLKCEVKNITGSEKDYSGGVVLIPSYLVKGLEFDMVIIADGSKDTYCSDELDVKLLYVAMTRPLHELHIYCFGERAEMLSAI